MKVPPLISILVGQKKKIEVLRSISFRNNSVLQVSMRLLNLRDFLKI